MRAQIEPKDYADITEGMYKDTGVLNYMTSEISEKSKCDWWKRVVHITTDNVVSNIQTF